MKWDDATDYMWIRNYSMDHGMLKQKLVASKMHAAYCCQCKWKTVSDHTEITALADFKWVCAGHTPENSF
jgi:hypothetical protein